MTETPVARAASGAIQVAAVPLPALRRLLLRTLGPTLVVLLASLFAVALFESWEALDHAAKVAEIDHPGPWPWMVDGFILVMALMVVHAKQLTLDGWALWGPRLGLVAATALSTTIQVWAAPPESWKWALHAWAAPAVLFSFECLIKLVYGEVRAGGAALPGTEVAGAPALAGTHLVGSSEGQPPRLTEGAPPPLPAHTAQGGPVIAEGRNLPDRPPPATPPTPPVAARDETVTDPGIPEVAPPGWHKTRPWHTVTRMNGLYERRGDPERFFAYVDKWEIPREEALAVARGRGWPVANGHREAVPA